MKNLFLLLFILVIAAFFYFKFKVNGDSNSSFNQTTRYTLGANGFWRNIFGLHNAGDARQEYLLGTGPVVIEWFKPVSEDVDDSVIKNFAAEVEKTLGRPTTAVFGGGLDDGTVPLATLGSFELKASVQKPRNSSVILVFFTKDYSPRGANELSVTYRESGIAVSLEGHKNFINGFPQSLNDYLTSSLLHEFGHEIGLSHSDDTSCIMSEHAGVENKPLEFYGRRPPEDWCVTETEAINSMKLKLLGD